MKFRPPRSPRGRIPHARLFGRRLRVLRNDVHLAHLLKQNLELKALVRALAEKYLEGRSRNEVRRLLHDVLLEQRRIYNEALSRQAIKEARSVDDLLLMLDEIRDSDMAERDGPVYGPDPRRHGPDRDNRRRDGDSRPGGHAGRSDTRGKGPDAGRGDDHGRGPNFGRGDGRDDEQGDSHSA